MWKERYQIGESQIDQQHKQMIKTVEDLLQATHEGPEKAKQTCIYTVSFLKDYARVHFGAEEMLQKKIGYPDQEAHKKMHDDFVMWLREKDFTMIRGDWNMDLIKEFGQELTTWIVFHIMREDKKMEPYVREYEKNHAAVE